MFDVVLVPYCPSSYFSIVFLIIIKEKGGLQNCELEREKLGGVGRMKGIRKGDIIQF